MDDPQPLESFAQPLALEAKRIEEDARFSSKGHFEAATAWDRWHLLIGLPTSIVAAIAGVSALSDLPVLAGILALLVATTSAVFTFLNPKERAAGHLRAGNAYKALQNDARIFREITCRQGVTSQELASRLISSMKGGTP